ncbi:MAG: hypothetical protein L6W00_28265 [Lentisphaeria bacterium]|nr:MAG: hypothetical protein L6W00_28265 [Lentisphaeria bacterium]
MKSGWFAATVAALSALTAAAFDSSGTLLLEERCDTPRNWSGVPVSMSHSRTAPPL